MTPPLWLAAAIVLGRCLGADWRRTRSFLSSDVALLVGGCAVMMVLAVLLDKSVIHFPGPDRFFEELLELSAYLYLLKTVRPAAATSYAYVNPAVAVLLGVTFAGEHFGIEEGLAMILIILAVVLIALPKWRQRVD